jgi:hypothetical protein
MSTIGQLQIDVIANIASLRTSFDEAKVHIAGVKQEVEGLTGTLSNAKAGLEAFVGALAIDRITDFVTRTAEAGSMLKDTAERLGLTVPAFQTYGLAASQAGISQEALSRGLSTFEANLGKLQQGISNKGFADLKQSFVDITGAALPAQQVLEQTLTKIGQLAENPRTLSRAIADATEIFGRFGAQMIPVARDVADNGFGVLEARAKDAGAALGQYTVDQAAQLDSEFKLLSQTVQNDLIKALVALAPEIQTVTGFLTQAAAEVGKLYEADQDAGLDTLKRRLELVDVQLQQLLQKRAALGQSPSTSGGLFGLFGSDADAAKALDAQIATTLDRVRELQGLIATAPARLADTSVVKEGPFVDPGQAKKTAELGTAYKELDLNLRQAIADQKLLLAAEQAGGNALSAAREQIAAEAAIRGIENDAIRLGTSLSQAQVDQLKKEAVSRAELTEAVKLQADANRALTEGAKQETDALSKTVTDADDLSPALRSIAEQAGLVTQAFNLGAISLDQYNAKIDALNKQLAQLQQTQGRQQNKGTEELAGAVGRDASDFLGEITKLGQSPHPIEQLDKDFLNLADDIAKTIVKLAILNPLLNELSGSHLPTLWGGAPAPASASAGAPTPIASPSGLLSSLNLAGPGGLLSNLANPTALPSGVAGPTLPSTGLLSELTGPGGVLSGLFAGGPSAIAAPAASAALPGLATGATAAIAAPAAGAALPGLSAGTAALIPELLPFLAFSGGGEFDVGGEGGTDTNPVLLHLTRGEHVAVTPAGGDRGSGGYGGGSQDVHVHNYTAHQATTRARPDGKGIDVVIGQEIGKQVASRGPAGQAMERTYGAQRTPIPR